MHDAAEFRLIPNGIDLSVFTPRDRRDARLILGLPAEGAIILFAAHRALSNPFKDLVTVQRAIEKIASLGQVRRPIFVCIGSGGRGGRQLENAEVQYVGFIEDPVRLALYYQAADVFVHAARAETFGKTVVESLACGTPVVATAIGGLPELIEHGANGFLTPMGDADAMAGYTERILLDQDLRRAMSVRAAASAQQYDLERQVDAFLGWYRELVDRRTLPPGVRT